MKIACVGYLHGAGGAERQIIMLANAMSEKGHDVTLIVMATFDNRYEIGKRVNVLNLSDKKCKKTKILYRFLALRIALKKIKPDITVAFWLQTVYFCALMKKNITGKLIYSERGDPFDKEYNGILGLVRKLSFYRTDGFVFQSRGASMCFSHKIQSRSVIIHNAVTEEVFKIKQPATIRTKRIVTVGRLSAQKNQKLLIDAFSLVSQTYPEYILEIYGEGELETRLKSYVNDLGLEKKVYFCGTRKNILDSIYDAELFVLTSDYEGMPNALMEAICIGIPCISTDCNPGGAKEVIDCEVDGLITPVDDITALKNGIEELICNYEKRVIFCHNGWLKRRKFSSKEVYDKWDTFLRNIRGKTK